MNIHGNIDEYSRLMAKAKRLDDAFRILAMYLEMDVDNLRKMFQFLKLFAA